ncbi:MAG TPA: response regulator transcription factor [Bryobacteraceae bacterium]|nr:response regulator transcription factor [Bryobacteraceae bacterium]
MHQNGNSRASVVIADELALLREGLSAILHATGKYSVVALCADGEQAMRAIAEFRPAVAILDFQLPKLFCLDLARQVQEQDLRAKVVILSTRCDRKSALDALRAGASAFLPKTVPPEEILDALEQVLSTNRPYVPASMAVEPEADTAEPQDAFETLSPREFQVFSLMVEGVRAKEIAARLQLSPKTVDTYRSNLMRKLDIHDLARLVKFAIQRDLTSRR